MSGPSITLRLARTITAAVLTWGVTIGPVQATERRHDGGPATAPVAATPAVAPPPPTSVLTADQAPGGAIPLQAILTAPPPKPGPAMSLLQGGSSSGPQLRDYALDALGSVWAWPAEACGRRAKAAVRCGGQRHRPRRPRAVRGADHDERHRAAAARAVHGAAARW